MMAFQVSKKIYLTFILVNLFTMFYSTQCSDSIVIKACMKNCIINQCMKASKKTNPVTCYTSCKIMCYPQKYGKLTTRVNVYEPPHKRFCRNFDWIFHIC